MKTKSINIHFVHTIFVGGYKFDNINIDTVEAEGLDGYVSTISQKGIILVINNRKCSVPASNIRNIEW